jgi:hypothetical protein
MDTHNGFGFSRQYYEDTLSEAALKRLSSNNFEELQDPLLQNPLDTLKNGFSRQNMDKGPNFSGQMGNELMTFHSKFSNFFNK